jgi:hypothetical protein
MAMRDGTVFDPQLYAENNPDVVAVYGTGAAGLYRHYTQYGKYEGRAALAMYAARFADFDAAFYAENNPDVVAVYGRSKARLYQHYLQYGYREGRLAFPGQKIQSKLPPLVGYAGFEADFYAAEYPDVEAALGTGKAALFEHYLQYGYWEGRYANAAQKARYAPKPAPEPEPAPTPAPAPTPKPPTPTPPPTPTVPEVKVGDTIDFGDYQWLVLAVTGGKALIITVDVIEQRAYHDIFEDITWAKCSLRTYLNGGFLGNFSPEEQARIATTQVESSGAVTDDQIFLLSIDEAERYFADNAARAASSPSFWWLRSPGSNSLRAANVLDDGALYVVGLNVNNEGGGVRPALWLNL